MEVVFALELGEVVLKEVHLAFVVVQQEGHYLRQLDQALELRALVSCEGNGVVVVFVHFLNCLGNFLVHVDFHQLRLLVVEDMPAV